jgi:hypothetical protein
LKPVGSTAQIAAPTQAPLPAAPVNKGQLPHAQHISVSCASTPKPEKDPVELIDAIPWILASLGIIISLGWNFFNYRRTTSIQRDIRQQQIRLEEFRRLRTRIDDALAALLQRKKDLAMAAAPGLTLAKLKSATLEIERAITTDYVELQDRLASADESAYATNADWVELIEPSWETYADQIFEFREQTKAPEARQRVDLAIGALGEIGRVLNRRLDQEIGIYANLKPKKNTKPPA